MTTDTAPPSRAHRGADRSSAHRWWVLAVVAAAQLIVVLDATIVNIALPHAQRALHISDANRQWVVTAYALAFGGLLLLGGRIADYTGRKRIFLLGLGGFAAASALGGAAQSGNMLFAARALQGAFAALLAPAALSILTTTFTQGAERAKAFAVYAGVSAGGGAVGLLVGGALTQYASWRWTLLINTPIALIAGVAGARFVVESRASGKTRYDLPGALTVTLGLVSLVYGFSKASTDGWGSSTTLGFLGGGVVLLIAFVLVELGSKHPLLPLSVVLDRNRGGANLAMIAMAGGMIATFLFLIYYMQGTLGYGPVKTGLATLPITFVIAFAVTGASKLLPHLGPRVVMAAGAVIAAGGTFMLSKGTVSSSFAGHLLPSQIVFGIGVGLLFTPLQNVATMGVHGDDAGAASALVNASQQVGGAIGVAVMNTFSITAAKHFLSSHPRTATAPAHALVHGYDRAFLVASVALLIAAAASGLFISARRVESTASELVPAPV